MRRAKLVLGVVAVLAAMLVVFAAPALADDNDNHNNCVEYAFDLAVHGDVGVHQPENNTYNDQYK